MISREEVDKLAELARLDLSEEERNRFGEEMGHILEYIDQIQSVEIETQDADPVNQNLMREDEVTNTPGAYTADILREMPETEGQFLKIHKILGDSE